MWSSQPKRLRFTIWDLMTCILVCVLAMSLLIPLLLPEKASLHLEISVDGQVSSYAIDKNKELKIENNGYTLTVVIENGGVYVINADCPDRVCEHTGKITKGGQSIACLPAKIVLTLRSKGGDIDAQAG